MKTTESPVSSITTTELSLPWLSELSDWIGEFVVHSSDQTLTSKPWLGIVSSHEKHSGFASAQWQSALRSAILLAKRQGWTVLCSQATPYYHAVERGCLRLSTPFVGLTVHHKPPVDSDLRMNAIQTSSQIWIQATDGTSKVKDSCKALDNIPVHDRAVIGLSHRVFAIQVRSKGKIEHALLHRLSNPNYPSASVYVGLPSHVRVDETKQPTPSVSAAPSTSNATLQLSPERKAPNNSVRNDARRHQTRATEKLLNKGAVGWLASSESDSPRDAHCQSEQTMMGCSARIFESVMVPTTSVHQFRVSSEKYLVHCTRARRGPWPDQSMDQFHDEILTRPWKGDPHPFETLQRILHQGKLIAGTYLRRSNLATVCFSNTHVVELLKRREFQSHLARWDWEPYGIMIDREWLSSAGALPVRYVSKQQLETAHPLELPFYQVIAPSKSAHDWREEREWRYVGDLRLIHVPFDKAFVFVPTLPEAACLSRVSRWPVVYLND